jgi:hypothetical protein
MRGRKGCSQARGCSEKINLVVKFFYKVDERKTLFHLIQYRICCALEQPSDLAVHLLNFEVPSCATPFPHLLFYSVQNGDVGRVLNRMGLKN